MGKLYFVLLVTLLSSTAAYCQVIVPNQGTKTIVGTVMSTDAVGNIISIRTRDLHQMSFLVPDKAIITQDAQNIGLMDITAASAVTIQYYVSPASKNTVVTLVVNESVINE